MDFSLTLYDLFQHQLNPSILVFLHSSRSTQIASLLKPLSCEQSPVLVTTTRVCPHFSSLIFGLAPCGILETFPLWHLYFPAATVGRIGCESLERLDTWDDYFRKTRSVNLFYFFYFNIVGNTKRKSERQKELLAPFRL
jgi:hypothetical protein